MQTEALYQALLATFTMQRADHDDDAAAARAATDILAAFAALIAPPVAVEGAAMVADDAAGMILAELQKQTDLLTTLCRHQDDMAALADAAMRHPARRTAKPIPRAGTGPMPTYNPVTCLAEIPEQFVVGSNLPV